MTIDQAVVVSGLSNPTISRIENGKQTIKPKNVRLLCQAYGVGVPLVDTLVRLAEESEDRGWWVAYSDTVPNWFEQYVGLETDAAEILSFETEYVPGLLQTAEYTRAITKASWPNQSEADLARVVELRQSRQRRLDGPNPPELHMVLGEAVARWLIGSPTVMREQLRHLIDMNERSNLTIQILPFTAGAHPGLSGPFAMLRFPNDDEVSTVYVEFDNGSLYPPRRQDIERYTWIFRRLQELALPVEDTNSLLSTLAAEL
nr:helix-turn-helix transcriptional regulator [Streptoalloteichus tenebrarius]